MNFEHNIYPKTPPTSNSVLWTALQKVKLGPVLFPLTI